MFGQNIKKIREEKGIGLNQLSRMSGVNASYISALERDEKNNPSIEIIAKIANALNVPVSEITSTSESDLDFDKKFTTAEEAMKFILNQPVIGCYGEFNINDLSEEDKIAFANDLLEQMKLISYKYKNK